MPHFQLIDPNNPTSMVSQITKQGRGSFYVKPTAKNNTLLPINGRATVDILGKKVNIALLHKVKDDEDPEPSVPKWSYFKDIYSDNNLTPPSDYKSIQSGYIYATAGQVSYSGTVNNIVSSTLLKVSRTFIADAFAKVDAPNSPNSYDATNNDMVLCEFLMFYKQPTIDPITGDIVIPTDDDTPASNRLRLPCNVAISNTPSWITNVRLKFKICKVASSTTIDTYDSWYLFRQAWDSVKDNTTDYTNVYFYYQVIGKIDTNSDTADIRPGSENIIAIQEINGDEGKIWGAKTLYLYIHQLGGYKRIRLYYKQASASEVTVPGSDGNYPVTAMSPGSAQISNHNLWFEGEACKIFHDEGGDDIITVCLNSTSPYGAIEGRGRTDQAAQDYLNLEYTDSSKNRKEYFYVGKPFFLGFVEDTNLYKDNVGINLYDDRSAFNFWHHLYFTCTNQKCSADPVWNSLGSSTPNIFQGSVTDIKNYGYIILFPWAVRVGNTWNSLYEVPTAYTNSDLSENSHRILAINWVDRATNGNPGLNKDTVKSTSDILYGGGVSICHVINRNQFDGGGWNMNPNFTPRGSGENRLRNYLQYVAQQWDNNPTSFGSPENLRNVKEILFVPMLVTGRKVCPSDMINASLLNAMCYGNSLIPSRFSQHQGYAPKIGIFPPHITGWF